VNLGDTTNPFQGFGKISGINQVVWDPATHTLHAESDEFLEEHTKPRDRRRSDDRPRWRGGHLRDTDRSSSDRDDELHPVSRGQSTWGPRHGPQAPNARHAPGHPGRSSVTVLGWVPRHCPSPQRSAHPGTPGALLDRAALTASGASSQMRAPATFYMPESPGDRCKRPGLDATVERQRHGRLRISDDALISRQDGRRLAAGARLARFAAPVAGSRRGAPSRLAPLRPSRYVEITWRYDVACQCRSRAPIGSITG